MQRINHCPLSKPIELDVDLFIGYCKLFWAYEIEYVSGLLYLLAYVINHERRISELTLFSLEKLEFVRT